MENDRRSVTLPMPSCWPRGDTIDYDQDQVVGVRVVSERNHDLTIGKVTAAVSLPDGLKLTAQMFDGYGYDASQHPEMYHFCPQLVPLKAEPPIGPRRHISECRVLSVTILAKEPSADPDEQNNGRPPQVEDILKRLKEAKTTPELDAMRKEIVQAIHATGTEETFHQLQDAFREAQYRLTMTEHPAGRAFLERMSTLEGQNALCLAAVARARDLVGAGMNWDAFPERFREQMRNTLGDLCKITADAAESHHLLDALDQLREQLQQLTKEHGAMKRRLIGRPDWRCTKCGHYASGSGKWACSSCGEWHTWEPVGDHNWFPDSEQGKAWLEPVTASLEAWLQKAAAPDALKEGK